MATGSSAGRRSLTVTGLTFRACFAAGKKFGELLVVALGRGKIMAVEGGRWEGMAGGDRLLFLERDARIGR